ncbi:MAG: hypothetical protein SF339_14670 [Blastocatellia bacterium]|nr:hypothetical protein [Blastocatellia bacterium]
MKIRFAETGDLAAVDRFNKRLKAGGREEAIPLDPSLPGESRYRPEGFPLYRRTMIAEDGAEVRAAMMLCRHNVYVHGERREFSWTKLPLSEGIIDLKYSMAIIQIMKKALDEQPFLMGVGAGLPDADGHRFFSKLRWRMEAVPFFFHPINMGRVMRELAYFKASPKLRYGALLGAYSGVGAGASGLLSLRRKAAPLFTRELAGYAAAPVDRFDEWADRIFAEALPDYPVAIRSDATALNIVYPPDDHRYVRLRVREKESNRDAGWIVVAAKQMEENHYFGNLKVGTLVDGMGRATDVPGLVSAGLNRLAAMGADIVVANFSHAAWTRACRLSGMFPGPSNYSVFVSPKGSPILEETCPLDRLHIARGHSDGMDNLL